MTMVVQNEQKKTLTLQEKYGWELKCGSVSVRGEFMQEDDVFIPSVSDRALSIQSWFETAKGTDAFDDKGREDGFNVNGGWH